jgi:gas vesicle protein
MRLFGSLLNFLLGALVGALIGALITALLTPQSGSEFKVQVRQRIDEGRAARDRAEAETTAEMTARFRQKVDNPNALKES